MFCCATGSPTNVARSEIDNHRTCASYPERCKRNRNPRSSCFRAAKSSSRVGMRGASEISGSRGILLSDTCHPIRPIEGQEVGSRVTPYYASIKRDISLMILGTKSMQPKFRKPPPRKDNSENRDPHQRGSTRAQAKRLRSSPNRVRRLAEASRGSSAMPSYSHLGLLLAPRLAHTRYSEP